MKFNWGIVLAKITSRKFWVWTVTTLIAHTVLARDGDHAWIVPVIVVWGIVTVIYLCGEVVIDAAGKAIEKAQISVGIGK